MSNILEIIEDFKKPCPCGDVHETAVKDVQIGSGLVHHVGEILKKNGFSDNLLLVADENTIKAADGILDSLKDFKVEQYIFPNLRVTTMVEVERLQNLIHGRDISVLSVGSGSVNDACRLSSAREGTKLCIFATAPSMDGFASYGAPIVKDGFKSTYDAKSPDVIIADTKILAAAPSYLKSAGFGDMIAKYVGLIDWKISALLTNEKCCERVANLTREATDELMALAPLVTENSEEAAGAVFSSLLKTGIAMSFTKTSRPASGAEHVVAHLMECVQLRDGIIPNYHGEDIGVFTLMLLKKYNKLAEHAEIIAHEDRTNWDEVYAFYDEMADKMRKFNEPKTCTDEVNPKDLQEKWPKIREIIHSVPSYEECLKAMKQAGCKLTGEDIGKPA